MTARSPEVWFAAGARTPFAKVDGPLDKLDAIALSVPIVRHMLGLLGGASPDFCVWGAVVPNLTLSNIAREILMDAGAPATIPAFSTVTACATSMIGAIEAAGMIDGANRAACASDGRLRLHSGLRRATPRGVYGSTP
jgi:acetyl-CoA C-acetyltransferase